MKIAAVVLLLFGVGGNGRPEMKEFIEANCVAVLIEAHTEKLNPGGVSFDPLYEVDKDGNRIMHVAEQTLKLRCK